MAKFRHIPAAGIVDDGAVSVESEWNPKNPGILHIRSSRFLPAADRVGNGWAVGLDPDGALALVGAILEARAELLSKRAEMMENGNERD